MQLPKFSKPENVSLAQITQALKNLLTLQKSGGDQLVFSYDGYVLSGAIVHFKGGQPELVATALSTKMNMQKSIEDIVTQFKQQKIKNVPKEAILASAEIVAGRVDIPVNSNKPKPKAQMHELVRWELESYISEIAPMWSVGALLEGYGFITSSQRQNASVELELSRDQGSKMIRFGEMCIQLGYITREQLNEMMALQERLMSIDGRMDCAWQAQGGESSEAEGTDVWLGAGVFRHSRRQWVDAFARNSLKLNSMVPLHGLGALFIDDASQSDYEQVLVEIFKERVVVYRFMGKAVVSVTHHRLDHKDDIFNTVVAGVSELMRPETESVWLSSVHADVSELIESLSLNLGVQIKSVQEQCHPASIDLQVPASFVYQFYALAKLAHGTKCGCVLFIDAQDPKPPLWKNVDFWRYVLPVFVVVAIGLNEAYMQYSLEKTESRLQEIESEKEDKARLLKQMQALIAQTNKEQEELKTITKEVLRLEKSLGQMVTMSERNGLVINLMLSLQESINDFVIVDRFIESDEIGRRGREHGFELYGWALNDNSAQLFSRELDKRIKRLGYEVHRVKINRSIGRSGIRGYGLSLSLLKQKTTAKKR